MRYITFTGTVVGLILFASSPAHADGADDRSFNWLGELSYSFGGDRLYTVDYDDGSSQDFDAGEGFTFSGGVLQYLGPNFGIKYALGFKVNESRDEAISVRTTAFPIDFVPYYVNGQHRFGAGLTYHISPKLDDDLFGAIKFDNAVGTMVEYSYSMFTVGYTDIDYTISGIDIDASHFNVRFTGAF